MFKEKNNSWKIVNYAFDPEREKFYEAIFSQANGYLGIRGSTEEAEDLNILSPATYLAGVYDKTASNVESLVNIPNWLPLKFRTGKEWFSLNKGRVIFFKRELDLKKGVLTRIIRWKNNQDKITKISITRFLSWDNPHLAAIKYSIIAENYSDKIEFESRIDGTVREGSKIKICLANKIYINSNKKKIKVKFQNKKQGGKFIQRFNLKIKKGRSYNIEKIVSVYSSREAINPVRAAKKSLEKTKNFSQLLNSHLKVIKKYWQDSDIVIKGDRKSQLAIRFSIFHLLQMAPKTDLKISIPAKGLSNIPEGGYRGHIFWDTEIYMLPFFIFTQPKIARFLLMYRYYTLSKAKEKAKKNGYQGAMYPWESAANGAEVTPKWGDPRKKKETKIWTGEREQHISADIAYAIWQYYLATKDKYFLKNYGGEIILETAKFWASRVNYNQKKKKFEILGVIGPDEDHEKYPWGKKIGIDNNFFTNAMASYNIQIALKILKEKLVKTKISKKEMEQWSKVVSNFYFPFNPETKIYSQFDNFLSLKYCPDLKPPKKCPLRETQIIKQADVIAALYLLPEFADLETKKVNYNFYEKRTRHGSSLGGGIHAVMAKIVGQKELAFKYFLKTINADLLNLKGNTQEGLHAASLGGAWQALIFGLAGLGLKEDKLVFSPSLPKKWQGLEFFLKYQGNKLKVKLTKKEIFIKILSGQGNLFLEFNKSIYRLSKRRELKVIYEE